MPETQKTLPCRLCATPTDLVKIQLCSRCWGLDTRVRKDPDIAQDILNNMAREVKEKEDGQN